MQFVYDTDSSDSEVVMTPEGYREMRRQLQLDRADRLLSKLDRMNRLSPSTEVSLVTMAANSFDSRTRLPAEDHLATSTSDSDVDSSTWPNDDYTQENVGGESAKSFDPRAWYPQADHLANSTGASASMDSSIKVVERVLRRIGLLVRRPP